MNLWRWKYVNSPCKPVIVVAEIGTRIIGCSNDIIFKAKLGSEIKSLALGDDLVVDTDFRGLGIWNKMRAFRDLTFCELTDFKLSTTVNPIVFQSWVKRNLSLFPFSVTRMVKTIDISQVLETRDIKNKLLVKFGFFGLSYLNKITSIFRSRPDQLSSFQIQRVQEFDESIDFFWEQVKDDYSFILVKKQEFLNWRFQDNDRGTHTKFIAVDGDVVLGYVVIGVKTGSSEGQILDLVALKERLDVVDSLLSFACEYFDGLGLNTVFYQVVEGHPYQEISKRHGFIDSRSRPNVLFTRCDDADAREIKFLKESSPNQVYFNYATTV
jgi:hypothetical protein